MSKKSQILADFDINLATAKQLHDDMDNFHQVITNLKVNQSAKLKLEQSYINLRRSLDNHYRANAKLIHALSSY